MPAITSALALPASNIRDYIALLKPRVMSLVVFTGLAGMLVAPGYIHPLIGFIAILCIALGSGAAGAINMWIERDTDALMRRTRNRPLPAGRLHADGALEFATCMAVTAVFLMAVVVNLLSALLLLAAILFYVFVYTIWLKPRTPQNIVIGGAAGAFPPLIGWAAVTGNIAPEPLLLFLIIFLWTPPHFWALSLYASEDYAKAGIPMLPVVKGEAYTKRQILYYTLTLIPVTLLPDAGPLYRLGALLLGGLFLYHAIQVCRREDLTAPRRMFRFSILYLFLLFSLLVVDHAAG